MNSRRTIKKNTFVAIEHGWQKSRWSMTKQGWYFAFLDELDHLESNKNCD